MKYFILFFVSLLIVSCNRNIDTKPSSYLNLEQQGKFKYDIIRYIERLPANATNENKFDTIFNSEYKKKAENSDLLFFYENKNTQTYYFAILKIAPSLKLKKVATVGKLKYDSKGNIKEYEEGFRTWKMEEKELLEKTDLLFKKYIQEQDLTKYQTINSNPKFFIEFPDNTTFYDKEKREWITKNN